MSKMNDIFQVDYLPEKRRMRVIDIIYELACIQAILYSPGHTTLKLATTINRINELIGKLLDSNYIDCSIEEKLDKLIKSIEKTPFKDCYIEELVEVIGNIYENPELLKKNG